MKYWHIVPGANDVANGMSRVARLLAKEQGDAEVVDLSAVSGQSLAVSSQRLAVSGEMLAVSGGDGKVEPCRSVEGGGGIRSQWLGDSCEEVWVHGMWLPREWAVCWRVLSAGKRLVRMTHGSLSPVYLKQQGRWKKWLVGPIERYLLRRCAKIVATCDAEKEWIEAYLGKKCPEIVVEDVKRFFKLGVRSEELGVRGGELAVSGQRLAVSGGEVEPCRSGECVDGDGEGGRGLTQRRKGTEAQRGCVGLDSDSKNSESLSLCVKSIDGELAVSGQRLAVSEDGCNSELDTRNRELHVLYLGRRHPLKGVEFLEAAVRQLQNSTRSTRSTRLKIELKIVSNAFGEELEKVWEWCDVLVLPTLSENFGLVVAEALERGKRVITTDGAPVWGQELGVSGDGWIGVGCGGRLLYLKGYRDGSDEKRVELLKKAILFLAAKV